MRGFEMSGAMPVTMQEASVTEQPSETLMERRMNPILQAMLEQRMIREMLFIRPTLPKSQPFAPPGLPPELRPNFDVGNGGRR